MSTQDDKDIGELARSLIVALVAVDVLLDQDPNQRDVKDKVLKIRETLDEIAKRRLNAALR